MKAVSLFSGCGGSDAGLIKAGFEVVMANDILPYAKEVYEANHPETDYLLQNIEIVKSFPSADVLAGCYPCQGFSQGGKRQADNKLNYLYLEFARALNLIKPKAFIVENVSGMTRTTFDHLLKDQIKVFSEAGYNVVFKVLNAADYGVAQERKRIFIVGTRNDLQLNFLFPEPTHGTELIPKKTIREALEGLPLWPEKSEYYDYGFHWYYMSRNRKRNWDETSRTMVSSPRHMLLHPISPDMVKISQDHWEFVSDAPARRFTYKEAARIQGFNDLIFPRENETSLENKYKVVGNAVPPPLFEVIARKLKFLL
ncbi:DNA cytosine methyltransferase [Acinetobacter populi]|uniref:Cytosine-specific methyltransferase n=1 Tax=Acinetobacter populi TaxID=1582270 RepID=A0A1Z9YXW2_9GAMM|nr:DNA cytosine methyltransferase [Acinetobacter populi]OUY07026.1 DNA (cytosine-5-)-methyltransferase [Acinetobacter populi]